MAKGGAFVPPKETYNKIATAAAAKANGPLWAGLVKAIFGGWMVALSGYCASVMASLFYVPNTLSPASRAAFAIVFPTGLFAILLTGADLYTGNTMAYTLALAKNNISILTYVSRLGISLLGNFIGATLGALILAGGTNHFGKTSGIPYIFINEIAKGKTNKPFWRLMFSAAGSNSLVCLAIWTFFGCNDSAGGFLTVIGHIGTFAAGGLEHVIANFFILNECLVSGADVSFVDVYFWNFVPVLIGNTFAGSCIIGLPLVVLYNERTKIEALPAPDKGDHIIHVVSP